MKDNTILLRNFLARDLSIWRKCAIEENTKADKSRCAYDYKHSETCDNECSRYMSMFHALTLFACSSGLISECESRYLYDGLKQEIFKGTIKTDYYRHFIERTEI